jgi:hypothetical protein
VYACRYNAADSIFNVSGVLPGHHDHNFAGVPIRDSLVDPDAHDFRPRPDSALHKTAAGAYRVGDPYWVPGARHLSVP